MRSWIFFGVVCTALALAGCEADQPLDSSSGGATNAQVQILGTASVPSWNVWSWTEDANGNGQLDQEPDLDGDGRLDSGEDVNHNLVLDPGEDRNGNGRLNFDEDFMVENGLLDRRPNDTGIGTCPQCEDLNLNCLLDAGEDLNGDGILQSEDVDCDNRLDGINEDANRNGVRDLEDFVEINSGIDAGIWCEPTGLPNERLAVPIPIAGEVLLYRQGNPTPEVLASLGTSGGSSFSGLTPYDDRVRAQFPDKDVPFVGQTLRVTQGQQLSASSRRVMNAANSKSPGSGTDRPSYTGLCSVGFELGEPNLGVPLPINVQVAAGDTFSIRLRSATLFQQIDGATDHEVSGSVIKDGQSLPISGSSAGAPGQSITFYVTVP